jgi:drug/metabolite transporter (DMT)-like permease
MNENLHKGIKLALLTAIISGLANFLNKEIIISGIDPVYLTMIKSALVGLVFVGLALPLIKSQKLQKIDWLKFIAVAIIGGSIPFILFFKGLAITTAIKASFIHKTLFVWVTLWSLMFFKEKIKKYQFITLIIIAAGILTAINFKFFSWGRGELMILLATLFWSAEIMLVKKFMKNIDFRLLAAARMFFGALIIFAFGIFSGSFSSAYAITITDWAKILIVSAFLFGYVLTWYKALSLAPASLVTNILTLAFPITILASSFKSFSLPKSLDIISIFLIFAGVILLIQPFLEKWKINLKI